MLGHPDRFLQWPQKKTFFRGGTFAWMDSGFHDGLSKFMPGKVETKFAHIHYHHKPYKMLVEHAKNKLRPYFDPDDISQLSNPNNQNRLTDLILQGEEAYLNRFKCEGVYIPQIVKRFSELGLRTPFA